MQLTLQGSDADHRVLAIDDASLRFASGEFRSSVIAGSMVAPTPWPPRSLADIDVAAIEALLALGPALILLGTGARLRFPAAAALAAALTRGVGIEVMDNRAAARTYNVLLAEGRNVLLACLLEPATPPG